MRANTFPIVLAALLSLGLTGCGDDTLARPVPEEVEPALEAPSEESSDPDLPSNEDLELFVNAIASDKVATLEEVEAIVKDGSPAAGYLTYYTHNINAQIDAGFYSSEVSNSVNEIDNGFRLCRTVLTENECSDYTDFQGEDGLIVDFQIEGQAASDRLVMGSGETIETIGGAEVEFIAAYMNGAGTHLLVSYDLHSGNPGLEMPSMSYRSKDGRQSQAEEHYGSWSLTPDSKSSYVAMFPGASLGGEAHLELWLSETYEDTTVVLPIDDN